MDGSGTVAEESLGAAPPPSLVPVHVLSTDMKRRHRATFWNPSKVRGV